MLVDHKLIRENIWLAKLSDETIGELAANALVRRLANGELWISRTDRANGLAIILQGGLRSTTYTEEGREYVFSIMKKGDIWGLVSTIDGTFNSNDVYAYGETTILSIRRSTVLRLMDCRPDFTRCLMSILCHRLRMSNVVLEDRALKPIDIRLARLLMSLRGNEPAHMNRDASGSMIESIDVTQETLAKILGCTRPTVNKQLKKLELEGIVKVEYGRIFLVDRPALRHLSGDTEYFYF